jgi:hypothetical protein
VEAQVEEITKAKEWVELNEELSKKETTPAEPSLEDPFKALNVNLNVNLEMARDVLDFFQENENVPKNQITNLRDRYRQAELHLPLELSLARQLRRT